MDTGGKSVRYTGDGETWKEVPAPIPLRRISVGSANRVVALDEAGQLHSYREPDGWQPLVGSFKDVSVAHDGAMWALNAEGHACIYGSETVGWHELPGTLRQISAGSSSNVWVLDGDSRAVDLTGGKVPFGEAIHAHHRAVAWDAQDPFDDTRSTHLWIVNMAARLAASDPDPAGRQVCELIKPGKGKIGDPFHDSLCQGLYDADYLDKYRGPMLPPGGFIPSWAGHFYDPDTKRNWQGDEVNTAQRNCGTHVIESIGERGWVTFEPDGNPRVLPPDKRGPAGYSLGLALHYLTDITQPMHASNFCWGNSHPNMAYHSDVEAYVMTRQSIAQSPDYTPSTNGPLGLVCPKRPPGDYECGDHSACTDFALYCHAASRNAKDKYAVRLIDQAGSAYYGWPGGGAYWRDNVVEPLIGPMLQDAILVTAQFLVGWMQFAKRQLFYTAYGDGWKNIPNGYLTTVSAAADGTIWGVNAHQANTTDNIYRRTGNTWEQVKGYLTSIAVGSKSEVWGVNAQMPGDQTNIARWNGSSWDSVGGYLTQIAVAPDGAVRGVNALQFPDVQNVYVWRGKNQPWGGIAGHLTQISPISASQFWGVNAEQYSYPGFGNPHNIYQYRQP
ncbi:MAG TPA: tectonin domain-containing protein [Chloroflexota bacterium]|nr:tectonin domain-containing protein [Chloroflexota bacterium]